MEKALAVNELVENILVQVGHQTEIIRAQRVCRRWRELILSSPALLEACWYRPSKSLEAMPEPLKGQSGPSWVFNPFFTRLGLEIKKDDTRPWGRKVDVFQEIGDFSWEDRIYDKPGSWTTMLATDPPCGQMIVECYSDEWMVDDMTFYLLRSRDERLLMGDVMAVLAECQNRQECGVDRWGSILHTKGRLIRYEAIDWDSSDWLIVPDTPSHATIDVAVSEPWGGYDYPAFSLTRLPDPDRFVFEMTLHEMVPYWENKAPCKFSGHQGPLSSYWRVCKTGQYTANLLVKKPDTQWYLSKCSHLESAQSDGQEN
ncbi:hypothetical protein BJY04DRAFT_213632 [Aspergillus karnatakaensis]|uniref:uncharacterized protein n=1 Tax=Aspergillus karnatakaensis TaxID=1810916 RepID=UPI003CCDEE18